MFDPYREFVIFSFVIHLAAALGVLGTLIWAVECRRQRDLVRSLVLPIRHRCYWDSPIQWIRRFSKAMGVPVVGWIYMAPARVEGQGLFALHQSNSIIRVLVRSGSSRFPQVGIKLLSPVKDPVAVTARLSKELGVPIEVL